MQNSSQEEMKAISEQMEKNIAPTPNEDLKAKESENDEKS